ACERHEMPFHFGRAHRCERGRSPARPLVLVYDHRSDPFVEVVSTHHAGDYSELGAHARGEIERRTASRLRKGDLETRRRFVRIKAAAAEAKAASGPPAAPSASSAARMSSTRSPLNSVSIAWPRDATGPGVAACAHAASEASSGTARHNASISSGNCAEGTRW